jgi:hypothetical protein
LHEATMGLETYGWVMTETDTLHLPSCTRMPG